MKINSINLETATLLNQTRNLTKNSALQLQTQQSNNVSYPQILPQQYMAMKGVAFGQLDSKRYDKEASLQLIEDIRALEKDDKAGLESILERIDNPNINANMKCYYGDTALMVASYYGHTGVVKKLLARKDIDVNMQNHCGNTALMKASLNGHTEIAEKLLKHKDIDVNMQDIWGDTALMRASNEGHTEVVKKLLARKDIHVNVKNHRGETALMMASENGHTEIVELIKNKMRQQAKNG